MRHLPAKDREDLRPPESPDARSTPPTVSNSVLTARGLGEDIACTGEVEFEEDSTRVAMGQLSSLLGKDFLVQAFIGGSHTFVGNSSFYAEKVQQTH